MEDGIQKTLYFICRLKTAVFNVFLDNCEASFIRALEIKFTTDMETFQYGGIFLRKLPHRQLRNGEGDIINVYEIGISTDPEGSNPTSLGVSEKEYSLPWKELVNVMWVGPNLHLIEEEYRQAGKIPRR